MGHATIEDRKGETDVDLLLHLFTHSLVDSDMCPDQESNLQPRRIRDDALTNEISSQGKRTFNHRGKYSHGHEVGTSQAILPLQV